MIRVIISALVSCAACLGASYFIVIRNEAREAVPSGEKQTKYESAKTRMVSVPILSSGEVQGYVVARFEYVADAERVKESAIPAESFVSDQAFKVIYAQAPRDAKAGQKHDVAAMTKKIKDGVNGRVGFDMIKDVLVDSWNYLNKKDVKLDEHAEP